MSAVNPVATPDNPIRAICGLDLEDRDNLDQDMRTMIRGIEKKYGFVPNFVKLFATDNQRLKAFMVPYMELMRGDSGLSMLDHELIALMSAATNGCAYCCAHHGAQLRGLCDDPVFAEYIGRNYRLASLDQRQRAMLDFAHLVLTDPEAIGDAERDRLRDVGFDDEGIWYVASTAAFYAGANRLAVAAGLRITPEYLRMNRT
ncbi:MAG: peroxidase-related enzyme [Gammaproteobacteria bacterium]